MGWFRPNRSATRVAAWLADFAAIRQEIMSRSERQWTAVQIYATAAIAIIGFCAVDLDDRWPGLVAVPVLSVVSLIIYWDHHRMNKTLLGYQERTITPAVRQLTGERDVLGWEAYYHRHDPARWKVLVPFALLLLFFGPPVAATLLVILELT
jgi:hypothetical protein